MEHKERLSHHMRLSWEIQWKKKIIRRRALIAAWAITLNEDITVYYLIKRHNNNNKPNKVIPYDGFVLFG